MSSANVLQSLNTSADGAGVTSSNRRVSEIFIASENLAANTVVSLDLSQSDVSDKALYVKTADTSDACPIGVIEQDYAAGEDVTVILRGIVDAKVNSTNPTYTDIAVGDALVSRIAGGVLVAAGIDENGTAAFNLKAATAIALAASSNTAETISVFVIKNF